MHCPDLLRSVVGKVDNYQVFRDFPQINFIWESIRGFVDTYGTSPSRAILMADLQYRRETTPSVGSEEEFQALIRELYCFTSRDRNEAYVCDWLAEVIRARIRDKLNCTLEAPEQDPREFAAEMESLVKEYDSPTVTQLLGENPFENPEYYAEMESDAIPTGIPWLDNMLDGGASLGEMGLWIIPQKCGKTLLSIQIGTEQVRMGNDVIHVSTEQKLQTDLTHRYIVRSSEYTSKQWKKLKYKINHPDLPADVRARMAAAMKKFRYKWWLLDCKKKNLHIDSIQRLFDLMGQLKEQRKIKPKYVILDWWGRLRDKMNDEIISRKPMTSDSELRRMYRTWLQQLKDFTEETSIIMLVMHQLAGAEAAKGSKHLSSVYSAQEDKNISQAFDFGFVSSKKDANDDVVHLMDVARTRGNLKIALHVDWDRCQLVPKKNTYEASLISELDDDPPDAGRPALTDPYEGRV
jgi:hypothetical protein